MQHFYHDIPGWFTFSNLYSTMVKRFSCGSKFIEIGTYQGRSAAYMAVEIANSNKDIEFHCVDFWGSMQIDEKTFSSEETYQIFLDNIEPVKQYIKPIKMLSHEAANCFKDGYMDFIYIDADHSYEAVKQDLKAWYPKLKDNGVFAGHDYSNDTYPGVVQAVDEFCAEHGLKVQTSLTGDAYCWIIDTQK